MARGNGRLTEKQVTVWFNGLEFDRQFGLLGSLAKAHGKVRDEKINTLKRELATLEGKSQRKSAPTAVKYRDPLTGATWSGRGRMANWLAAKVKAGEKLTRYLTK